MSISYRGSSSQVIRMRAGRRHQVWWHARQMSLGNVSRPSRIGILGGTFDPFHSGHLDIVEHVLEENLVDQVLVIPAPLPPHKSPVCAPYHRLQMALLACQHLDRVQVLDIEFARQGSSYTIDTLHVLAQAFPASSLYLLMGWEMAVNIQSWVKWREILNLANIIIVGRFAEQQPTTADLVHAGLDPKRTQVSSLCDFGISSTDIRRILKEGEKPEHLPMVVMDYIEKNELYR